MSRSYNIAVVPGDGTGPEVIAEGVKVLDALAPVEGFKISFTNYDFGGERFMKTGVTLPDGMIDEFRKFDAVYLGAIGHPDVKPGILEKGILLRMRFELDQYINLRPVKLYPGVASPLKDKGPEDIDYVVIRENTGGLYSGAGGVSMKGTKHEIAIEEMVYSYFQVERCLRYAFEYTRKHSKRNTLALVGKTNVLTNVFGLWERVFRELGDAEYPDIKREYYHVDATCLYMVSNPEMFDVIVTENMFGDIITDLAAITQGGLGIAAGGNINPDGVSLFEPIGGTAPMWTGKNAINPIAAIGAAQMMMKFLGEDGAASRIEKAVGKVITRDMKSQYAGQMGITTKEVGDRVAAYSIE